MNAEAKLFDVLQSTSDVLYPDQLGEAIINIDSAGYDGDTPLHVLIWRGDTGGALLLIENGAPVNAVGDMGETPLHVAVRKCNKPVIETLFLAGAKSDIVSEFGKTAIEEAADIGIKIAAFT